MKKYWKPLLAVVIFLVMQLVAGVFVYVGTNLLGLTSTNAISCSVILSGLLTVGILSLLGMIRLKTFNPMKIKWKQIPTALAAAILGIIAMNLLSEQLHLPDFMKQEFGDLVKSPWGILAIAVIGPVVEELVFRENLIHSLLKHVSHRWQAILISALAFGFIHFNPAQIPFAIVLGIILGIIYVKTGNIVITSLIHIFNNSLAVIEMNVLGEHIEEFHYSDIMGGTFITWGYILICAILCYGFLGSFWKNYHRHQHT